MNQAINDKGLEAPDEICNYVRQKLVENISQDGGKDGMDGTLICWDSRSRMLCYASAYNTPFLVRGTVGTEL